MYNDLLDAYNKRSPVRVIEKVPEGPAYDSLLHPGDNVIVHKPKSSKKKSSSRSKKRAGMPEEEIQGYKAEPVQVISLGKPVNVFPGDGQRYSQGSIGNRALDPIHLNTIEPVMQTAGKMRDLFSGSRAEPIQEVSEHSEEQLDYVTYPVLPTEKLNQKPATPEQKFIQERPLSHMIHLENHENPELRKTDPTRLIYITPQGKGVPSENQYQPLRHIQQSVIHDNPSLRQTQYSDDDSSQGQMSHILPSEYPQQRYQPSLSSMIGSYKVPSSTFPQGLSKTEAKPEDNLKGTGNFYPRNTMQDRPQGIMSRSPEGQAFPQPRPVSENLGQHRPETNI